MVGGTPEGLGGVRPDATTYGFEEQENNAFVTALNGGDFTLGSDSVVVTAEGIQATVVLGAEHIEIGDQGQGKRLTQAGMTFVANQLQGISPQAQALATELFQSKTASQVHVSGGQVCKVDLTDGFKQRQATEKQALSDKISELEKDITEKAPRKILPGQASKDEHQRKLTELEDLRQYKKFTEAGEQLLEQLSSDRVNFDEASKAVGEMEKAYKALEGAGNKHMLPALAAKYKNNDEGDTITALYHLLHHNWRPEEQLAIERSSSDFDEFKEGLRGLTGMQSSSSYRPTSVVPQGSSPGELHDEDDDSLIPSSSPQANHLQQQDQHLQRKALAGAPPPAPKTAPPPTTQIPTAKPAQAPGAKPGDVTLEPAEASDEYASSEEEDPEYPS